MAGYLIPTVTASLTANGDVGGIGMVTVADASLFTLGAVVSLSGDTVAAGTYQIVSIDTTTNQLGVRILYAGTPALNGLNYGYTTVSQYTVADSAKVIQSPQFIYDAYTQ